MSALKFSTSHPGNFFDTTFILILGNYKEAVLFSYQFCIILLPQKQNQHQP